MDEGVKRRVAAGLITQQEAETLSPVEAKNLALSRAEVQSGLKRKWRERKRG
uniref:Uncharacterized protein n=1 Tax=Micrococcus phage Kurnik TaxID=3092208 RepID=A0AAU6R6G1_9CAUD